MTYWSSAAQIVFGLGMKPVFCFLVPADLLSSSRTSWQRSMHWSQMKTPGPATSLRTWSWPFPQNEQRLLAATIPVFAHGSPRSLSREVSRPTLYGLHHARSIRQGSSPQHITYAG